MLVRVVRGGREGGVGAEIVIVIAYIKTNMVPISDIFQDMTLITEIQDKQRMEIGY